MANSKRQWVFTGKGVKPSNYANPSNWLSMVRHPEKDVDVFFLYATTYVPDKVGEPEVCNIDNIKMREHGAYQILAKASVFEPVANIYAPYYRQIDARLLVGKSREEGAHYFTVPKMDIFAALDYYFAHLNNGRPFILAGHSQGSILVCFILAEYMRLHPELLDRMVAAYVVGFSVTRAWLQANPHLHFATGAEDAGCVISWNVEGPENLDKYNMVVHEGAISINPLNWRLDEEYASTELNLGTLFVKNGKARREEGIADAQLDLKRGVVVCRSVDPKRWSIPYRDMFGPASYHSWDYGFYYENIRHNVADRIATFWKEHSK